MNHNCFNQFPLKAFVFILMLIISNTFLSGQEIFTRFSFSGYKVVVIKDSLFKIDIKNNVEATQEITSNKTLELTIKDQRGRVPKDTIYVYTNKIDYLALHNSELLISDQFKTDSLKLELVSTFGKINIQTNYLDVQAGAGSQLYIEGEASFSNWEIGAGSSINAQKLTSHQAKVDVEGHSSLAVNCQTIIEQDIDNSFFKNIYEDK